MDRRQFFGDSVAGTIVRLVLLSVVVGVVFSALGITPFNLIERLDQFVRNILDMGLDAFNWAFSYFLLGAVIVFPSGFWCACWPSRATPGCNARANRPTRHSRHRAQLWPSVKRVNSACVSPQAR